uniref:LIM zinc-binding domain-containing protein n=1 Tax=Anopheles minimus TaxID=112268 RepID=A0A182WGC3_9DIPT
MRAKDLIFHVNCFSCLICGQLLRGGDTAGIRDGRVFCGDHYESEVLSEPETISPQFFPVTTTGGMLVQSSQKGRPRKRKLATPQPPGMLDPTGGSQHPNVPTCPSLQSTPTQPQAPQLQTQQTTPPQPLEALDAGTPLRLAVPVESLCNSHPRRTGRTYLRGGANPPGRQSTHGLLPRFASLLWHFNHVSIPKLISGDPTAQAFAKHGSAACPPRRTSHDGGGRPVHDPLAPAGREIIIIRVWFQNARAKWRRNVMRQDVGMGNPGQTLGGLPSIGAVTLHHHSANGPNGPNDPTGGIGDLSSTQVLEEMHNMTFAELY